MSRKQTLRRIINKFILCTKVGSALPKQTLNYDEQFVKRPEDWGLFQRIDLARQSENNDKAKNYWGSIQGEGSSLDLPKVSIEENDFSAEKLVSVLTSLKPTGGMVFLPAGRLEINQPVILTNNIKLIGVPEKTELVFIDVDYPVKISGQPSGLVAGVTIENLRIFHQGEHKFCSAVYVSHSIGFTIQNVEIIEPRAVGILMADKVYGSKLIDCMVNGAALGGYMLVRDVHETIFDRCSAEYCLQSGLFLTDLKLPENTDLMDFDAQIDYTNKVIGNFGPFSPEDPSPYRTIIQNSNFSHNRKMGITTDGVGYLSVKNTVIAHNDCEGITIDNGSWGCQLLQCHIYDNGWRGKQHEIELGVDFVKEMGLMDDGSSKAKLPGVSLDNAAYTRIEHNHIESNWGDGVKFVRAAYANTIANNLIENNNRGLNDRFHFFGVLVGQAERQHPEQDDFPSCNNRMIGNDILGAHFAGIHLMSDVQGNFIKDNHIDGATFAAIENHGKLTNYIAKFGNYMSSVRSNK